MRRYLDWLGLPAYCLFIYWLSAQEKLPTPDIFTFQDKILHFGAYFIMAVFAWLAFRHWRVSSRWLAWTVVLFCSLYGASDEFHQSFVPGRSPSVLDWLADSSGAALSSYLLCRFKWLTKQALIKSALPEVHGSTTKIDHHK